MNEVARDASAAGPRLVAVCVGPGGIPKHPVPLATVGPLGLAGDYQRSPHHGGPNRAVSLLAAEEIAALVADGVPARGPGAFGENLVTEGLDPGALRPGDRLRIGPVVELVLTDVRAPCSTLCSLDPRFPDLMLGRSGFLARVERGGPLEPGMPIVHIAAGAPLG
ncbi:MAG: MOSC domain-containing protein [Planctomycetaceae bacterium]|nr:MOSC domain-containing protein [Planctomycetaceae bacterium]